MTAVCLPKARRTRSSRTRTCARSTSASTSGCRLVMKPSLQVRSSQHLALTPQLQQSIRLLQLSTLELHQEVEQMLAQNPLLEPDEDYAVATPELAEARVSSSNNDEAGGEGESGGSGEAEPAAEEI